MPTQKRRNAGEGPCTQVPCAHPPIAPHPALWASPQPASPAARPPARPPRTHAPGHLAEVALLGPLDGLLRDPVAQDEAAHSPERGRGRRAGDKPEGDAGVTDMQPAHPGTRRRLPRNTSSLLHFVLPSSRLSSLSSPASTPTAHRGLVAFMTATRRLSSAPAAARRCSTAPYCASQERHLAASAARLSASVTWKEEGVHS